MHAFTPQQLSGGQRYGSRTKIGNWLEDLCLEDVKKKEGQKSIRGNFDEKMRLCNRPVRQTLDDGADDDGIVRYGRPLSLFHGHTGGTLACDPLEVASCDGDPSARAASVCRSLVPAARNSFVFVRADGGEGGEGDREGRDDEKLEGGFEDDAVRWGEPFRIACCSELVEGLGGVHGGDVGAKAKGDKRLYLASVRATALSCERLVYMTECASSYDAQWVAHVPGRSKDSGYDRLINAGAPILLGEPLALQHCATWELLSADKSQAIMTDFGGEFEVRAHTEFANGRVGTLREEMRGSKTGLTNCRPELEQNIWMAITLHPNGQSIIEAKGANDRGPTFTTTPTAALSMQGIIIKVRDALHRRGLLSMRILGRELLFSAQANEQCPRLGLKEVGWILVDCGVRLDESQLSILCQCCHRENDQKSEEDGGTSVHIPSLLEALRGEFHEDRFEAVMESYDYFAFGVDGEVVEAAWDALCNSDWPVVNNGVIDFATLWDWPDDGVVVSKEGKMVYPLHL